MNTLITIDNLAKVFPARDGRRKVAVFENVDLKIHAGEFLVILGPSGCGKSTLLRILAGLDAATHGQVTYHPSYDPLAVGFVFQDFGLLPWLSVEDNVGLPLCSSAFTVAERQHKVAAILAELGLSQFAQNRPRDLSGGMRQRVGLARAFVIEPKLIFLDEPFSELDFFTANHLRQVLLTLWQTKQTTIVMVSHYIDEAVALADRIAVFSDRPGKIKTVITNELARPRSPRTLEFFTMEDRVTSVFSDS